MSASHTSPGGEGIDLVIQPPTDNEDETSQRMTIEENLPLLPPESWSEDGSVDNDEFNDQASGSFYSMPSSPTHAINTTEGRWEFIMKKLISIENNTTSLREDFSSLSDKVDSQSTQLHHVKTSVVDLSEKVNLQSTQLLKVKSSAASNEKRITEVDKRQESAMANFDQQMGQKFKIMELSLKQENERFQQVLLKEANKKIQESTGAFKDERLQDQCEQRKLT